MQRRRRAEELRWSDCGLEVVHRRMCRWCGGVCLLNIVISGLSRVHQASSLPYVTAPRVARTSLHHRRTPASGLT
ncbi:hypothetical protein K505DRAFT_25426 [Melanomma pulvis-pyrius CBS 109.77]|uniref:Uncharacterized protein n=1 Tax=Melanomma pulvis-pyrius CBS 109.77 TaxID=1314802 RepID=A0A6A6XUB3_9PLEO|nr:hypothetical protein K505DRAFT_25426 [Melanomma pulvis-pyrius CBS 109.77]